MVSQFTSKPQLVNRVHAHTDWNAPLRYAVGIVLLSLVVYFVNRLIRDVCMLLTPKDKQS